MEETGTTRHSGLTRRNKFLRENPQSCQIDALVSHPYDSPAAAR